MRQKLIKKNEHVSSVLKTTLAEAKAATQQQLSISEIGVQKDRLISALLHDDFQQIETFFANETHFFAKIRKLEIDFKHHLQHLLQTAILIEHSTIPPYLTALYSIQAGHNQAAAQRLRSVAVEEMLHMIMVCNVMNALALKPSVNCEESYPSYPAKLPLNVDFYVGLSNFSVDSMATFIAIESPTEQMVRAPEKIEVLLQATPTSQFFSVDDYLKNHVKTIGGFYDFTLFVIVIAQILRYFNDHNRWPKSFAEINEDGIFIGDVKKQIDADDYYGSGGELYTVENLRHVIQVFQEIKGQGEGADQSIFSVDPSQFDEQFELAHYFRFKEIFHEHCYVGGDYTAFQTEDGLMSIHTPPNGKALPVDWDAVYLIKSNVKLSDYEHNPTLYHQAIEFNKTYKKLLNAIQTAIEGEKSQLAHSILYMHALREQAVALMRCPLVDGFNAGPTFEYINF